ncbi:hypothetical protein Sango_2090900, partial [Sesamum angolense]
VQHKLSNGGKTDVADQETLSTPAALALKQKRLTFAWVDGEAQHIISWISQTIKDGDTRELPPFNENKPGRRSRRRKASNQLIPPSITDVEPKDAKQIPLLSDSESE